MVPLSCARSNVKVSSMVSGVQSVDHILHQALGKIGIAQQYAHQVLTLATELNIPLQAQCRALIEI